MPVDGGVAEVLDEPRLREDRLTDRLLDFARAENLGLLNEFETFRSEFLGGQTLPGVAALTDKSS